ncbi:hypothetical protein ECC02_004948 [Trypanosoma cruzi]|uniref:Uncharacterized protein n=1 Tax=Trypanosoma cruzi TaxID=5693 RepID=A0A7J6Y5J0_TRYCR|nr:hypothetical protein ECC02_004948 [Trypanosoma cruzi]
MRATSIYIVNEKPKKKKKKIGGVNSPLPPLPIYDIVPPPAFITPFLYLRHTAVTAEAKTAALNQSVVDQHIIHRFKAHIHMFLECHRDLTHTGLAASRGARNGALHWSNGEALRVFHDDMLSLLLLSHCLFLWAAALLLLLFLLQLHRLRFLALGATNINTSAVHFRLTLILLAITTFSSTIALIFHPVVCYLFDMTLAGKELCGL